MDETQESHMSNTIRRIVAVHSLRNYFLGLDSDGRLWLGRLAAQEPAIVWVPVNQIFKESEG